MICDNQDRTGRAGESGVEEEEGAIYLPWGSFMQKA